VGGENNGWAVGATHLELEHGGAGSVQEDAGLDHLVRYCLETTRGGTRLMDDPDVRDVLADALIDSHAVQLFGARNFWHRLRRQPHPYGGAQLRYFERMVRLNNARRVQQIVGLDALIPDTSVHEVADFEYAVRSGPGMLHGGGTLDTDRLIIARRMGLGRSTKEAAPTTI
jgi:alkylation response protein AidB-like acyl-CoA dehydrogenase